MIRKYCRYKNKEEVKRIINEEVPKSMTPKERRIKEIDEFYERVSDGEREHEIKRMEKIEKFLINIPICKSCRSYLKPTCEFSYYLSDRCDKANLEIKTIDIIKDKYQIKEVNGKLIGEFKV